MIWVVDNRPVEGYVWLLDHKKNGKVLMCSSAIRVPIIV